MSKQAVLRFMREEYAEDSMAEQSKTAKLQLMSGAAMKRVTAQQYSAEGSQAEFRMVQFADASAMERLTQKLKAPEV